MNSRSVMLSIYLIAALAVSFGCAKKRPVEKVYDLDANRWAKLSFDTGKNWLGKVTVVKTSQNDGFGFIGLQSDLKLGYFNFTENELQFVSAIDLYGESDNAEQIINAWSITHSDYFRPTVNGKVSNQEIENNRISWQEKRFFKVDWETAKIKEKNTFPYGIDSQCWSPTTTRVVEDTQEIAADHVSFVLAVDYVDSGRCFTGQKNAQIGIETYTVHYKYSFIPEPQSDYEPYVYTGESDPLLKKFGYFNTTVAQLNEHNQIENTFLMNRWHPNKTHTFYFTEDFPQDYKWIFHDPNIGIIVRTNNLLADNDIKMRFEIKDSDGSQTIGDLRYSMINFVDEASRSAPLGYGPSDAHPMTGEIISASTTIWTSELKNYVRLYKEQIEKQAEQSSTSPLYKNIESIMSESYQDWERTALFAQDDALSSYYRYLLPEFTYNQFGNFFTIGHHQPTLDTSGLDRVAELIQQKMPAATDLHRHIESAHTVIEDHNEMMAHMHEHAKANDTIYYFTPEVLGGANLQEVDEKTVIDDILYRTSIHEFGHNLNLRHNFYGSVDHAINREEGESINGSSSVMDYLSLRDEIGLKQNWEEYDQAALLYAYSNGKKDLSKQNSRIYLFCTDQHVPYNPLCNQFDTGATPTEIVGSLIRNYDLGYWTSNFRWGRAFWDSRFYDGRIFRTMFDIKKVVKLYRETFLPQQVQAELSGLPNYNPILAQQITGIIRRDISQAVKLAASFYSAVIKMDANIRPFTHSYDDFTGELQQVGIFSDKYFAKYFLMGDDPFPLNPNFGQVPVSFIPMRTDPVIGETIDDILIDTFVNSGDAYVGLDNFGRALLTINAGQYFDFEGQQGAIDLLRIDCFNKASFESKFNLDVDVHPNFDNVNDFFLATLQPEYTADADPYFANQPEVAVVKIRDDFYVASTSKNRYSASLIEVMDLNGVLNTHLWYNLITNGRNEIRCK